jgi:hypothetical protein
MDLFPTPVPVKTPHNTRTAHKSRYQMKKLDMLVRYRLSFIDFDKEVYTATRRTQIYRELLKAIANIGDCTQVKRARYEVIAHGSKDDVLYAFIDDLRSRIGSELDKFRILDIMINGRLYDVAEAMRKIEKEENDAA